MKNNNSSGDACKPIEQSQLNQIIDRVQMLNNVALNTHEICERVGDNILGIDAPTSEKNAETGSDYNGTLQHLIVSLDELEITIRRGLSKAERLITI